MFIYTLYIETNDADGQQLSFEDLASTVYATRKDAEQSAHSLLRERCGDAEILELLDILEPFNPEFCADRADGTRVHVGLSRSYRHD